MSDEFVTADRFDRDSLTSLANGEVDAVVHAAFYPATACQAVLGKIVMACERASYTLTKDLQSLGTSIGEASESPEAEWRYLSTAAETTSLIRDSIFDGRISPGDLVRLYSDEWWPAGATVGRFDGRQMLPNVIRRWPQGGHANPHIDQLSIPLLAPYDLTRRLGVNVYLETPERGLGGEIDFWHRYESEQDYLAEKRADYGIDRSSLGPPLMSIAPGQGDLILFDAARLHGVRRVERGSRVTAACFLGVRSEAHPLVVFA
jgi:hypothetical protein